MESLHPGVKWSFRIGYWFFSIFLLIFAVLAFFFSEDIYWIVLLIISFSFIFLGELFVQWEYKNWKYEFTKEVFKIEKGIIIKKYKSIPYERIQNVDITRGIIARIVGFSTIDIQTAGYSMYSSSNGVPMLSEGHIPAVSMEDAEKIREFLMKKITGRKQGL